MPFYLGIEKAVIHDSGSSWFFDRGRIRFHSFVADEFLSLPGVEQLVNENDPNKRRQLLRDIVSMTVQMWISIPVEGPDGIEDRHTFRFGETGKILFESARIPSRVDWFMFVIDQDDEVRDLGHRIQGFLTDERVDSLAVAVISLSGMATSPASAAAIVIAKATIKIFTEILNNNKDDQIGYIEQPFIRPRDYRHGTRQGIGVQDLTANMWYDYFIYGWDDH